MLVDSNIQHLADQGSSVDDRREDHDAAIARTPLLAEAPTDDF